MQVVTSQCTNDGTRQVCMMRDPVSAKQEFEHFITHPETRGEHKRDGNLAHFRRHERIQQDGGKDNPTGPELVRVPSPNHNVRHRRRQSHETKNREHGGTAVHVLAAGSHQEQVRHVALDVRQAAVVRQNVSQQARILPERIPLKGVADGQKAVETGQDRAGGQVDQDADQAKGNDHGRFHGQAAQKVVGDPGAGFRGRGHPVAEIVPTRFDAALHRFGKGGRGGQPLGCRRWWGFR